MLKVGECPQECEYKHLYRNIKTEKDVLVEEIKGLEREHDDINKQLSDGMSEAKKTELFKGLAEVEAVKREKREVVDLKKKVKSMEDHRDKLSVRLEKVQKEKNEILSATELDVRIQQLKKSKSTYESELVKKKTEFVKYSNAINTLNTQLSELNIEKRNLVEYYNSMLEKVNFSENQVQLNNKLITQYRKELGILGKRRMKSINNIPPHIKGKRWWQFWKRNKPLQQRYYDDLDIDFAVNQLNRGGDDATKTTDTQV